MDNETLALIARPGCCSHLGWYSRLFQHLMVTNERICMQFRHDFLCMMCNRNLLTVLLNIVFLAFGPLRIGYSSEPVVVPDRSTFDIFERIISINKSNYERIHTMRGTYAFEDKEVQNGDFLTEQNYNASSKIVDSNTQREISRNPIRLIKSTVTKTDSGTIYCVSDQIQSSFYCDFACAGPPIFTRVDNGKQVYANALTVVRRSIVSPHEFLCYSPNIKFQRTSQMNRDVVLDNQDGDAEVVSRATREHATEANKFRNSSIVFNPFDLLGAGNPPIWQLLERFVNAGREAYAKVDQKKIEWYERAIEVTKTTSTNGSALTIKINFTVPDPKNPIVSEYWTFDENSGRLMSFTQKFGDKLLCENMFNYRNIDTVFVPAYSRRVTYQDGRFKYSRTLKLQELQINETVPSSVFTIKHLGMKNGDEIKDSIDNKTFVFADGSLLSPEQYFGPLSRPGQPTAAKFRVFIIANTSILIAVVAWMFWRGRRTVGAGAP